MKIKYTFLVLAAILMTTTRAQTKWISHKSHSGANSTMFADAKNNFGPGMVIHRTLEEDFSDIELKYKTFNKIKYPIVTLDSNAKVIRYIDVNDSLIGCDRSYKEYLTQGVVLYDMNSKKYFIYQNQVFSKDDFIMANSPQAFEKWANYKNTQSFLTFIYSGEYKKIRITYPYMRLKPKENNHVEVKETIPQQVITNPVEKTKKIEPANVEQIEIVIPTKVELIEDQVEVETSEKDQFMVPIDSVTPKVLTSAIGKSKMPLYIIGLLLMFALWLAISVKLRIQK